MSLRVLLRTVELYNFGQRGVSGSSLAGRWGSLENRPRNEESNISLRYSMAERGR